MLSRHVLYWIDFDRRDDRRYTITPLHGQKSFGILLGPGRCTVWSSVTLLRELYHAS